MPTNLGNLSSNVPVPESGLANGVAAVPVGTILDWFPPASATAPYTSVLPSNWIVCSGQTWASVNAALATAYGAGTTNDLGFTSGNVPDLIGKVTYGASTSASRNTNASHTTSDGTQTSPGVGGTVGTNVSANWRHNHSVPDHLHDLSSHTHGMQHTHYTTIPLKQVGSYWAATTTTNTGAYLVNSSVGTAGETRASTDGPSNNMSGAADRSLASGYTDHYYQDNRTAGVGMLKIMKVKYL